MSDDSSHSLVIATDDGDEVFPIPVGETTIGRSRSNHLTLRESSVSRAHCRIERVGDEVRVYDAASRNPTRLRRALQDEPKNADGKVLRDGDTVIIGRVEVVYRGVSATRPSTASANVEGGCPIVGATEMTPGARQAPSLDAAGSGPESPGAPVLPNPLPHARSRPAAAAATSSSSPRRRRRVVTVSRQRNDSVLMVGGLVFVGFLAAIAFVLVNGTKDDDSSDSSTEIASRSSDASSGISDREARLLVRLEEREKQLERTQTQIQDMRDLQRQLEEALQQNREARAVASTGASTGAGTGASTGASTGGEDPSSARLIETREAIARLMRRENEIRGDLQQMRVNPLGGVIDDSLARSIARRREAMSQGRTGRIGGIIGGIDDDTELDDDLNGSRGRTIVEKIPQSVQLSKADYGNLVDRLKETVGNYGLPSATPSDLEPDLTTLLRAQGDFGARGLIAIFEYSQKLERDMGATVSMLQKRVDGLLAKAGAQYGGKKGEGSKSKGGGMYKPQGQSQHLEQLQRLLELSDKKIQIKKQQRVRLEAFQGTLGDAFADLTQTEATLCIVKAFSRERDNSHLRRHMCSSFAKSHALQAVPVLIKALRVKDTKLKSAVHQTLVTIAGKDLGDAVGPWNDWYKAESDG
jgi:hypothetical protein